MLFYLIFFILMFILAVQGVQLVTHLKAIKPSKEKDNIPLLEKSIRMSIFHGVTMVVLVIVIIFWFILWSH